MVNNNRRASQGLLRFFSFSLLELVTVITILILLTSLLLPAALQGNAKSKASYCMNNLRMIGIAAFTYSEEYDQYVMPGKFTMTTAGNYNHWINYMYSEMIPDKSTFRCPTLREADNFNPAGSGNLITQASYIRNIIEPGNWAGAAIDSDPNKSWGWGTTTQYIRIQEVRNPSDKIDVLDVISGGVHPNHSGIRRFQETDHGLINVIPLAGFRRVGFHHQLGFNVLMGDGHTEYMKQTNPNQWVVIVK